MSLVTVNLSLSGSITKTTTSVPGSDLVTSLEVKKILECIDGTVLQHVEGSYTPNQDYLLLWTADLGNFPNLLLLLTSAPIGLTIGDPGGAHAQGMTVNGLMLVSLSDPKASPQSLYLDGRDVVNSGVIAQGVSLNYMLVGVKGSLALL